MTLIFRTIFGNFLERFSAECKALAEPIVAATVGMYNTILADLRPTPAKSHYTYNLRDLSKVFQVKPFVKIGFPHFLASGEEPSVSTADRRRWRKPQLLHHFFGGVRLRC